MGKRKPKKESISEGIKKWLIGKKFVLNENNQVDQDQYEALLKQFALSHKEFDAGKTTKIESYERYVHNRFKQFCSFCIRHFENK